MFEKNKGNYNKSNHLRKANKQLVLPGFESFFDFSIVLSLLSYTLIRINVKLVIQPKKFPALVTNFEKRSRAGETGTEQRGILFPFVFSVILTLYFLLPDKKLFA